jgi:predicted phosphoribosyltransferase
MGRLQEEMPLRNKVNVFKDRKEAGRLLAEKLVHYKGTDSMVLGIPAGGVPVAAEIADALGLPMDLIIVRKIQLPDNTEAGFGAMGPDEELVLNEKLLRQLMLNENDIKAQIKKTADIIKRRNQIFRQGKQFPCLKDKNVIVVDDGLASGYTMLVAVRFIKKERPKKIIVAAPTGLRHTVDFILSEVDELVCLNVRSGYSFAVADAYQKWYDLTDQEVMSVVRRSA